MNLQLNKKTNIQRKIMFSSLIFAIMLVFAFLFVLIPIIDKITQTKILVSNLKIEIINNQEKEKNIDQLTNKLKMIEPQIEKLNNVFVTSNHELDFIIAMENFADKNNVIQTLNITPPTIDNKNNKLQEAPLELNIKGSFSDIYNYLNDIESMDYYFSIEEFSLGSTNMPGEKKIDANLHLLGTTYWN